MSILASRSMRALIVVPARFGSTRLPGKPLLPIAGRTLLQRVHAVAQAAAWPGTARWWWRPMTRGLPIMRAASAQP
jgi:hypothetical protein